MSVLDPIIAAPGAGAAASTSDLILFWNEVALEANVVSHTNNLGEQAGPPLSARALAIVHLAMYDAFAGVSGNPADLPPYLPSLPTPGVGATLEAAVGAAAYVTLLTLFPSQRDTFDAKLAERGVAVNLGDPGFRFGHDVADELLDLRRLDPGVSDVGYMSKNDRGRHRRDPDNPGQPIHAPHYGRLSKGFAISARHELLPPPFDDSAYEQAIKQVRGQGIAPQLMGTLPAGVSARTADQTVRGIYWAYDGRPKLGTPPRFYNLIVRRVGEARGFTTAEYARIFALVNVAMADAGILAWDQKYKHDLWRPVVGLREHDHSFGPAATTASNPIHAGCDPDWLPLGAPATNPRPKEKNFTPPFPAYPSGHATFGAAALHMLRLFCGITNHGPDTLFDGLDMVSEELDGKHVDAYGTMRPAHRRSFPDGVWQMILENGHSRIDLGVHWVFDAFMVDEENNPDLNQNIGGVPLGLTIAEDIFNGGRADGLTLSTVGPRTDAADAGVGAGALPSMTIGGSWRERIPYLPSQP